MGAEAVIEKINSKSKAECEQLLAEARLKADAAEKELLEKAGDDAKRIVARAASDADALKRRECLKAEFAVREKTLCRKQELLSKVFDGVKAKLAALPQAEKQAFYERLVADTSLGGKVEVCFSEDMRSVAENGLKSFCEATGGAYTPGELLPGEGKLLLRGEKCDADLSLDSIIGYARDSFSTAAAKILFE